MKKNSKLQKKLDKIMKKIHEAGLKVKKGKVVGFKYIMQLSLNTEFYSHYDEYTNDAIMSDDSDFINLPDEVMNDMKNTEYISFDIVPVFDKEDIYSSVQLKLLYKGNDVGCIALNYNSAFTKSWKEYKTLPFRKVSKTIWVLDGLDLEIYDTQGEHVWAEFEITRQKEYL